MQIDIYFLLLTYSKPNKTTYKADEKNAGRRRQATYLH